MKKHTLILTGTCLALAASQASAALYNLDFQREYGANDHNAENDNNWTPVLTDGIGTVQDDKWNIRKMPQANYKTDTNITVSSLVDTQGNTSNISFSAKSILSDGTPDLTPRSGPWTSWIYTEGINGSTGASIDFTGFDPGAVINLVIYTGNAKWGGINGGDFTFGGVTKSYSETLAIDPMPLINGQTYVRFDGLTADNDGKISGTFGNATADDKVHVLLSGLQIQIVPEPSTTALLGLGALALVFRRRK